MKSISRRTAKSKIQIESEKYVQDRYEQLMYEAVAESAPYIVRQAVAAVLYALKLHGYGEKRLNDVFRWTCDAMQMPEILGRRADCDHVIELMAKQYNIDFTELKVEFQSYEDYKHDRDEQT